jgi:predicted enzyme related to lactoylglutathione lyase
MYFVKAAVVVSILAIATPAIAQQGGAQIRSVRVFATDPDVVANFYEKTFGMSEIGRPANTPTMKEIRIKPGSTADMAQKAPGSAITITTRPKDAPVAAQPSIPWLVLEVTNLDKAIELVKANGGTLVRSGKSAAAGVAFAMVKDPEGNQFEIVMSVPNP